MKRPNNRNHRIIWEKFNNKKLPSGTHVHHIDGNPNNNDPLNLIALTAKEHYNIHLEQKDYAACILLAKSAEVSSEELRSIQHLHGIRCRDNKLGFHSENFDRKTHLENIWKFYKPGRKPVTNGDDVIKLKTSIEVEEFLLKNPGWDKGIPDKFKAGLKLSTRRYTSEESSKLAMNRLLNNTHNFTQVYECPNCSKIGKGPMMKRWHFNNCKQLKNIKG